jgi:hypothetical protein
MAGKQANTAEELTAAIRSLVDKALESDLRDQIVGRGRDVASTLGTAGEAAAERATEAWRESEPMRREAAEAALRAGRDTVSWGRRGWTTRLRPALRDGWTRRMAALAAAGVAVPTSRQVMDQARARLGIQRREERRWRSFFLGLFIGAVAGAIASLLTAPRAGREMRDELATRAREAAATAREAASATDWVPLFQRPQDEGLGAAPAEMPANQPVDGSDPLVDEALPVEGVAEEPAPAETVPSAEDEVE